MFTFRFRLEGIGISLINADMQEILYASAKGVVYSFVDATTIQQNNFSIKWVQVNYIPFFTLYI